jgi:hypothetical protein
LESQLNKMQESKVDRVASYRHLQAVSQQINLLTAGRLNGLDAFSVPPDIFVSEVKPGHRREVRRDGTRHRVYHRSLASGEEVDLLPTNRDWWKELPMLVLQFDQGPTCTAAAAFLD